MVDVAENEVLKCLDLSTLPSVANQILSFAENDRILLFKGDVGVGKTTLIKEICLLLQVEDQISSPTFSIINEYETRDEKPVYHFDFYRINSVEEAQDIGVSEYFYSGHFCFIEWPEIIGGLLPSNIITISISVDELNVRYLELTRNG